MANTCKRKKSPWNRWPFTPTVPAAAHAGWYVLLKILWKSIRPNRCLISKSGFPLPVITTFTYATTAVPVPKSVQWKRSRWSTAPDASGK